MSIILTSQKDRLGELDMYVESRLFSGAPVEFLDVLCWVRVM